MFRFFCHIGQISAFWAKDGQNCLFTKTDLFLDIFCHFNFWPLVAKRWHGYKRPRSTCVYKKKSRKDWWNMVVWMQPVLYSSVVWHRCTLVYLCWNTPCVNTYRPNVCLIIPEKICFTPSQYIRHATKIYVNCRHNLTNIRMAYTYLLKPTLFGRVVSWPLAC